MPTDAAHIVILGAGTWGSTLAWLHGAAGHQVTLWTRDENKAKKIKETGSAIAPVSISFDASIVISSDLNEALQGATLVLFCCTSQTMRQLATQVADALAVTEPAKRPILVSAVKGLELHTFKRMSEVLEEILPGSAICALSGPNLADEILRKLPTASVVSSKDADVAARAQSQLSAKGFRVYTNTDIVGVELGGALKNVIAIAAGVTDGLQLGLNAKAALLTRGLAEMTRLAVKMGARPTTLAGLTGMGDLFATSSSESSRNHRLGVELAKGKTSDQALAELGAVAEGVTTTYAVCEFSQRLGLELPIAEQVESMLTGKTTTEGAIMTLMARPLASE